MIEEETNEVVDLHPDEIPVQSYNDIITQNNPRQLSSISHNLGSMTAGSIRLGNAWHIDKLGNMWWGDFDTYDDATIKISAAGVANLSGLIVGTNVGLGTAEDSAGVTTIIGDTVTTSYLNAKNITAGSVAAENITAGTITGSTVQTATTGQRVIIKSTPDNLIQFLDAGGYYTDIEGYQVTTKHHWGIYHGPSGGPDSHIIELGGDFGLKIVSPDGSIIFYPTGITIGATLRPNGVQDIGSTDFKWQNLYLSGNITVGGTVDGVDIYAHSTNASAHHTKYTDANARSAVTGNTLPGNLVLGNHEVNDVSYLKFDSSYGRIYHGATEILDFYSTYLDCNVELKMNDENISGVDNLYVDDIYGNNVTEIDVFESFDMNGHNVNGIDTLSFDANTGNPSSAGQIQYYDYGGVQQFRANVGGWTGRFDLIAT